MDEQQPQKITIKKEIRVEQQLPTGITTGTWMLMFATAIFFEVCKALLQFIPFMGQILAIMVGWFAFGTFWLWFKILGAKYSRKTIFIGFLTDFIPFIDVFSETGTILALYLQSKATKVASKVPGADMLAKNLTKKS